MHASPCRFPRLLLATFVCWSAGISTAPAQRPNDPNAKPSPASEQVGRFHLPLGFKIELVADESQVQKPFNLAFDTAGRVWVTGSELYPFPAQVDALGRPIAAWQKEWDTMKGSIGLTKPTPPPAAIDTLRILSDFGPDGRARKVEVFADGLNIPIGVQPLPRAPGAKGDTAIVFSIPSIWRLEDTDGDGRADRREELYTGFGFIDTHGMSSNYLYWIDGWIYGCHGFSNRSEIRDRSGRVTVLQSGNTYRFKPDGSAFEMYTFGQTNPFGLTVDPWGNFYSADSHSKPVYLLLPGAYYEGLGRKHDGLGFAPAITNDSHGSSAIAGIAWYADNKFPAEFQGNVFIGNPITQRVNRDRFEWQGGTPMAVRMPDFLTCDDPWFRPVQVKLGPDGALYVADFYVPIIGHYEHPLLDPRRDHSRGRVWRITWRGEQGEVSAHPLPRLEGLAHKELVAHLADANLTTRTLATQLLVARGERGELTALLAGGALPPAFSPGGLWAAERMETLSTAVLSQALESTDEEVAVQAIRILGARGFLPPERAQALRDKLASAATLPRVRRAVVETFARHPSSENLVPLVTVAEAQEAGPDLELKFALRVALREHLRVPAAFEALQTIVMPNAAGPETLAAAAPALLADVALALPTVESASFVLGQMARLDPASPRTADYVGHIARYLPEGRLDELLAVIARVKDSPPAQQFSLASGLARAAQERSLSLPADVSAWIDGVLLAALEGPEGPTKSAAVADLKLSVNPAKREPLQRILATVTATSSSLRSAALDSLMNLPEADEILAGIVTDARQRTVQRRALELIAQRGNRALALEVLPLVPGDMAAVVAQALVKNDADAGELLALVERGRVPAGVLRSVLVADALGKRSSAVRERAARLTQSLPPENARIDGIIAARLAAVRDLKADRAHGYQVFQANCMACHRYKDEGGSVAPNLDGISARGADRLAEDILDPNRNVDGIFRQAIIETKNGQSIGGINLREFPTTLTLTDATGKDVQVDRATVKTYSATAMSLMPAAFDTVLSEQEFADLLAYLLGGTL